MKFKKKRWAKESIYIISVITLFVALFVYFDCKEPLFDVDLFNSKNYTREEIDLFNDICFMDEKIRKWETNIRLEVKGVPGPKAGNIDSVIMLIAPLIKPLKIELVKENGNIIIYRGVSDKFFPVGIAYTNSFFFSPSISRVWILEAKRAPKKALMHEIEHALGLAHPRKTYPFLMRIIGKESPQRKDLKRLDYPEYQEFYNTNDLTDQEKKAIQMLYSPEIKSGLKRKTFMKQIGLNDNLSTWNTPILTILIKLLLYIPVIYVALCIVLAFELLIKYVYGKCKVS